MSPAVFAGRRRWLSLLLVLTGLAEAGTVGAQAFAVRHLFDATLLPGPDEGVQVEAIVGFLVAAALTAGLEAARRAISEALGQDYANELRLRLFEGALADAALRPDARNASGRLLPFVGDLSALRRWVANGLTGLVVGGVATIAVLLLITVLSRPMGAVIAIVLIVGAGATMALSQPIRTANHRLRHQRGGLSSFIGSRLEAAGAVVAAGRIDRESAKVEKRARRAAAAAVGRAAVVGVSRGIARVTAALMLLAALLVGALEVRAGHVSAGTVIAVTGLTGLLSLAVRDLGLAFELWHAAKAARLHIDARLAPEIPSPRRTRRRGRATLALEKLKFGPLDEPFSVSVSEGQIVRLATHGETSTQLLAVLGGLASPWSGRARVVGRALDEVSGRHVARLVGYASARAGIIRGSLGMNLTYRRSAPPDEVARVVDLCGLGSLASRLGGLGGEVRDGGTNLSPAERQAVLIARALLGTPPLLVLDDVDSFLEPDLLNRLVRELATYPGVVVVSSRRPELIELASQTWRLDRDGLRTEIAAPTGAERRQEPLPCPA